MLAHLKIGLIGWQCMAAKELCGKGDGSFPQSRQSGLNSVQGILAWHQWSTWSNKKERDINQQIYHICNIRQHFESQHTFFGFLSTMRATVQRKTLSSHDDAAGHLEVTLCYASAVLHILAHVYLFLLILYHNLGLYKSGTFLCFLDGNVYFFWSGQSTL